MGHSLLGFFQSFGKSHCIVCNFSGELFGRKGFVGILTQFIVFFNYIGK